MTLVGFSAAGEQVLDVTGGHLVMEAEACIVDGLSRTKTYIGRLSAYSTNLPTLFIPLNVLVGQTACDLLSSIDELTGPSQVRQVTRPGLTFQ